MTTSRSAATPSGFWVLWAVVAADLVGFGIVLPLLPVYADDLGASPTSIGVLLASFSASQFVTAAFWGRRSDVIGRKPVLIMALTGSVIGSLVTGLASSFPMLVLGRIIDGSSGASAAVAYSTVADLAEPEHRPRLMGLIGAAYGVGFVVGPAIGALGALIDPRVPFFVAAGVGVVTTIAAVVRVSETAPIVRSATPPWVGRRFRTGDLVVASGLATVAFVAFETTLGLLVANRFGFGFASVAGLFGVTGIAVAVANARLVGPLVGRLGAAATLRSALVADAVGLVIVALSRSVSLSVIAVVVVGTAHGVVGPTVSSLLADRADPGRRGQVFGRQQSAGAAARIVGPIAAGWLFGVAGDGSALVGASIVAVAAAVVVGGRADARADVPAADRGRKERLARRRSVGSPAG